MLRVLGAFLIVIAVVGTVFFEKTTVKQKKSEISDLKAEISKLESDPDFKKKKRALRIAKKYLHELDYSPLIYYPLDLKLQYYQQVLDRYFSTQIFGSAKILFQVGGDVSPSKLKLLYPSVYQTVIKVLLSFQDDLPYFLLTETIDRFSRNEAAFVEKLYLSPNRCELVFSVLGPLDNDLKLKMKKGVQK